MISVQIRPLFSPDEPMMWDVYTYYDGKLLLVEKLPTSTAQRRWMQAKNERARAEAVA